MKEWFYLREGDVYEGIKKDCTLVLVQSAICLSYV